MKLLTSLSILVLICHLSKADIPAFDVIVFANEVDTVYTKVFLLDSWQKRTLYYNRMGKFIGNAKEVFLERYKKTTKVHVYGDLAILNFSNVLQYMHHSKHLAVHLKNLKVVPNDSLIANYQVIDVIMGELYGAYRTTEMTESDNRWMQNHELEVLFSTNFNNCELDFISIAGVFSVREKQELKSMVEVCGMDRDVLNMLLSNFYKSRIIMNGFCSC